MALVKEVSKLAKFQVIQGDITQSHADAIVNAANTTLLGGGGVDGAIHRAAGPKLLAACIPLNECATGEAKVTPGFDLAAKWVIHTPGPVWHGGMNGEADLLANSYRNSLELAAQKGCQTIDFPSISTGVYGYPLTQAAAVAVKVIGTWLAAHPKATVRLVAFDATTAAAYSAAWTAQYPVH